jgi:hypothetical protein
MKLYTIKEFHEQSLYPYPSDIMQRMPRCALNGAPSDGSQSQPESRKTKAQR